MSESEVRACIMWFPETYCVSSVTCLFELLQFAYCSWTFFALSIIYVQVTSKLKYSAQCPMPNGSDRTIIHTSTRHQCVPKGTASNSNTDNVCLGHILNSRPFFWDVWSTPNEGDSFGGDLSVAYLGWPVSNHWLPIIYLECMVSIILQHRKL